MHQSRWFFTVTIVIGFIFGSMVSSPYHSVFTNQRQNKPQSGFGSPLENFQPLQRLGGSRRVSSLHQPVFANESQGKRQSVSAFLTGIFQPMRRKGGTRSGSICLVTPGLGETRGVWSDRPLFLWDREISRVEVRLVNTDTSVWNQTVPSSSRSIVYQGQPLQPGQTYVVLLFDPTDSLFIKDKDYASHPKFTLMAESERSSIAQGLAATENQFKSQGSSDETIALEKAELFTEKKLWSDALQTIYSVQNSSLELQTFVQTIITDTCKA
jgi:hypothetical protein